MTEKKEKRIFPLWTIIAAFFLILAGLMKIYNISWEIAWPYILIAAGTALLIYATYVWTTGKEIITEKYE